MRGFWVNERLDRFGWKKKDLKYIFFKKIEKRLLFLSNKIVCLTHEAKEILIMAMWIRRFPALKAL